MDKNNFINRNSIILTIITIVMLNLPSIILGSYSFKLINIVILSMFTFIFLIIIVLSIISAKLLKNEMAATEGEAVAEANLEGVSFLEQVENFLTYIIKIYNKSMELIDSSDNFREIPSDELSQKIFFGTIIIFVPIVLIIIISLYFVRSKKKNNEQSYKNKNTNSIINYNIKFTNLQNIILIIFSLVILYCFFKLLFTSLTNNVTLSKLNSKYSLYSNTFLISFIVYVSLYCYFVDYQNDKKIDEIKKKI